MNEKDVPYDVVVVGQGAAAYSAALYAARYQLKTVVVGETFGGETATGGLIENYPGYQGIDGFELMVNMKGQVEQYGVRVINQKIETIVQDEHCFEAKSDEGSYVGGSVILAVGRERRKLGLAHEDEWTGKGVSFCATCDAPLYRGKVAGIVGGGDAAVKGAVLLGKYANDVYIIYRGGSFTRPEPVNLRALEASPNVHPVFETNVVELKGEDGLSGVGLNRAYNNSNELKLDGLFIEIGADPRVELAQALGLLLNEKNEIVADKEMRTNVHGVFVAGDVTDGSGDLKQTITAAAQGAIAATSAYAHVVEHPNVCAAHAVGYRI